VKSSRPYFFFVFFVAFFFMALFSLGLDLAVFLPGFLFAGIGTSSASLLPDERQTYFPRRPTLPL
jgi:hypothetical protein